MSNAARATLITTYRKMMDEGLIQGTAGNVSIRTERGMIITPSSVPASQIDEASLCEFDLDTGLIGDAGNHRPSSEWMLHLEVYRHTNAGAVVHTHSLAATAVSLVADELPAVHYYITRLGGPVPVVPYATYGSDDLAHSCAAALRDRTGAILANHGAVTIGSTLAAAYERATWLEWICELYLKAAAVAAPRALSLADLQAVRDQAAVIEARGYRCG